MKHLESVEELKERVIELELEAKGWEEMKQLLEQEDVYTLEDLKSYIEEHSNLKDQAELYKEQSETYENEALEWKEEAEQLEDQVEDLDFKLSSLR